MTKRSRVVSLFDASLALDELVSIAIAIAIAAKRSGESLSLFDASLALDELVSIAIAIAIAAKRSGESLSLFDASLALDDLVSIAIAIAAKRSGESLSLFDASLAVEQEQSPASSEHPLQRFGGETCRWKNDRQVVHVANVQQIQGLNELTELGYFADHDEL
jgi:hypothetical protein